MADILKGAPAAAAITEDLAARCNILKVKGVMPALAMVRVGERADDLSYQNAAMKRCEKIGIAVKPYFLPADCTKEQLLAAIAEINNDSTIHGCLMFRPLPEKAMEEAACAALSPAKDVDCMTDGSLAVLLRGNGDGFPPCTAQGCMELLKHYGVALAGKKVAVVGRSLVIGKPVSLLLQKENATVTMCHTQTVDLPAVCRDADIVVAAAGKAGLVTARFVRPGQTVVDVGINVDESGNLCGDVDFAQVEPIVSAITPVPGGVGNVTTAVLCKHVIEAAERSAL